MGNIAEIKINGHEAGIVWMRWQQTEVTQFLKTGINHLGIRVTNTSINRIAAMKEATPVPDYLVSGMAARTNRPKFRVNLASHPCPQQDCWDR